jgi:hypothetical protein
MPILDEHCKISLKRTSKDYRELHEWIDEPKEYYGKNHRIERHSDNEFIREFITKKWGEKAVIEWLFHIAVDNLQTAYKASHDVYEGRTYNYYKFALAEADEMFFDCGKLSAVQLVKTFKEDESK